MLGLVRLRASVNQLKENGSVGRLVLDSSQHQCQFYILYNTPSAQWSVYFLNGTLGLLIDSTCQESICLSKVYNTLLVPQSLL